MYCIACTHLLSSEQGKGRAEVAELCAGPPEGLLDRRAAAVEQHVQHLRQPWGQGSQLEHPQPPQEEQLLLFRLWS